MQERDRTGRKDEGVERISNGLALSLSRSFILKTSNPELNVLVDAGMSV